MELRVLGGPDCVVNSHDADFSKREFRNTCGNRIGNPEKALDVIPRLKGMGLINVDRSWRYWGKGLLDRLAELDMFDQLLMKCPANDTAALDQLEQSGYPFLFMPIVDNPEDFHRAASRKLNLVAAELLFHTETAPVVQKEFIAELKSKSIAVWMNAITMSMNEEWSNIAAHHDDDAAVLSGPEQSWGWMIQHGADIIQTDWPTLLHCYLAKKFPGSRGDLFSYESGSSESR